MDTRPKTLFLDIDGTLIKHCGSGNQQANLEDPELLPDVLEKLDEWDRLGYRFILVTGRRESERQATVEQLRKLGIVYDYLIMGLGGGQRVVVNDLKDGSDHPTAGHVCIKRNEGIGKIVI